MNCDLCNVCCPSSYQYDQHIRGRKHAERIQAKATDPSKKNLGVCFYWGKGTCYKGSACTFLHTGLVAEKQFPSADTTAVASSSIMSGQKRAVSASPFCQTTSAFITPNYKQPHTMVAADLHDDFIADIILCKGIKDEIQPETKLAPIFLKQTLPKDEKKESRFPEIYRNAFHRKRNVNLYIREDVGVVFEFAYDINIITAVKTQIKGRTWNPTIKCWTCPVECLPDAIALYEHMGRQVDKELQRRAKDLTETSGLTSDSIQMFIRLQNQQEGEQLHALPPNSSSPLESGLSTTIGSIQIQFLYDADIVSSLKKLSPLQRTYDPATKTWTTDVLALPELLEHLGPFGYVPNQQLKELAKSCTIIQELLWSDLQEEEDKSDGNQSRTPSDAALQELSPPPLEAALQELVQLVAQVKASSTQIDRSGCGQAKRRKLLTPSQRRWPRQESGEWDSDSDDYSVNNNEFPDYYGGQLDFDYGLFCGTLQRERQIKLPDCDCGQPYRRVGGKHVCRYFGTFQCDGCHNRWTSAYCWKGEKQACRRCNQESLPIQVDQLDGRPPVVGGGVHDSERCAMCRRLGRNCSL